jgi:hypothetical protein
MREYHRWALGRKTQATHLTLGNEWWIFFFFGLSRDTSISACIKDWNFRDGVNDFTSRYWLESCLLFQRCDV